MVHIYSVMKTPLSVLNTKVVTEIDYNVRMDIRQYIIIYIITL